jgi:putative membrane protein insertion efficiency factor
MPASLPETRMTGRVVIFILEAYRRFLSPLLPRACRFHPTCSQYCAEAIRRHGVGRGAVLGLRRLLRCQPFTAGGFDPVA